VAACLARSGIAAVATATPMMPTGMYISRNAKLSAVTAPSSALVASEVLTSRLICAAATPSVAGPIRISISRKCGLRKSIDHEWR
jgi:hypothetical protein